MLPIINNLLPSSRFSIFCFIKQCLKTGMKHIPANFGKHNKQESKKRKELQVEAGEELSLKPD